MYATAYQKGVWRSTDNGATWTNIHVGFGTRRSDRSEIDSRDDARWTHAHVPDRGRQWRAGPYSRFFIADSVESGTPTFTDKTSSSTSSPGYATFNFCTGQCWYDQGVYSPPGQPNMVYVYGSFVYAEAPDLGQDGFHTQGGVSNGRAVVLSTDGGNTFTDLTEDASSTTKPQGLHPDQHALITLPSNPLQFFEGRTAV